MNKYYIVVRNVCSDVTIGDIVIVHTSPPFEPIITNLSTGKKVDCSIEHSDVDRLTVCEPVYKGKDTTVTFLHKADLVVTVRDIDDKLTVFKATVKGNSKNDSATVAKNKAKLKRKNYIRSKGYFNSREDAEKSEGQINNCTLLKKWTEDVEYPLLGSGKIDGIRCTTYGDGKLMSRGGKEINAPHIVDQLGTDKWMDGELYIPNASLETIQSIVSSSNSPRKSELHYFIFDKPEDISFISRLEHLESDRRIFSDDKKYPNIHIIHHKVINNSEEARLFYLECLNKGYEGAVYRTLDGVYKEGRTPEIMKRKPHYSAEFEIVDVLFDKDHLIYFRLVTDDGKFFKSVPEWIDEDRKYDPMLASVLYIGRYAEVIYWDKTAKGVPKFTNVKTIRQTRVNSEGHVELIY